MAKRGARRAARDGRAACAADPAELPGADSFADAPRFEEVRPSDEQRAAFERAAAEADPGAAVELGCVVRLDRGFPLVVTGSRRVRAEHAVAFARNGVDRPAVGDWVVLSCPGGHEMGVIERILPRRTVFERWRGGSRGERQVLAANVDTVLIVAALSERELSCERIARSLVLVNDCGADPVVVLTKADRKGGASALEADCGRVRELAGDGCRIVTTSSFTGDGVEAVRSCVPAGSVAMILGESGAGKSTLLNALLGHEAQRTGAVRARDDAGRHTTVARVMLSIPGGGVIADAPGLRNLPLVGHERGLARTFPEIVEAARGCRFGDCTHTCEPGCAVRELEARGKLSHVRLEAFLSLAREMRVSAQGLDPDISTVR